MLLSLVLTLFSQPAFAFPRIDFQYSPLVQEFPFTAAPRGSTIKDATTDDLLGMASLRCSGSLVEFRRAPTAKAVMVTNGHCASKSLLEPGKVLQNVSFNRGVNVFIGTNDGMEQVHVSRVLYATMTGTDVALFELEESYANLTAKGARVFSFAAQDPAVGTPVRIVSGMWQERQDCDIHAVVPTLREGQWSWANAMLLGPGCVVRSGYSGTPVLSQRTNEIVAIVNTVNENGLACELNNPCEDSGSGDPVFAQDRSYAQRTTDILGCVSGRGEVDLSLPGCRLPGVR